MYPLSPLERVCQLQLFWQVLGKRECDLPPRDVLTLLENAAQFGGTTLEALLMDEETRTFAAVTDALARERVERDAQDSHEGNVLPTETYRTSPAAEKLRWSKKRLGEILVELGVIDRQQLSSALEYHRWHRCKLGIALRELQFVSEDPILEALSLKLGYDRVDLDSLQLTPTVEAALRLVPKDIAMRKGVVPIACDGTTLTVALLDPSNLELVDELAFRSGRRIRVLVAGEGEITRAIVHLYSRNAAFLDPGRATGGDQKMKLSLAVPL